MKSAIRSTAQLARELGLSRWTVSRALNGHPGLNEQTVALIKETARRHGFSPNILGRGLRSGRTNLVGICLPDLEDYFLTAKISLLQETLSARGLHPVLQITDGTPAAENAALERFSAMRCAAALSIASRLAESDPASVSLAAARIPLVRIDPLQPGRSASVSTDRRSAMVLALAHLHALGHRKLAVAGFSGGSFYNNQRLEGLKGGCRKFGWNFKRDLFFLPAGDEADDFAAGAELAHRHVRQIRQTSAILAINDRVALGLMNGLQPAGIRIPEEISIIGYDNADFSSHLRPALTTIDPQVDQLIAAAVDLLLRENAGGEDSQRLVHPRLIARKSTGKLAKKFPKVAFSD